MANFIDRRLNSKNKSTVNRQRFIRRYKSQIKRSVENAINKRGVTDVDNGENITIARKDLSEPVFHQGNGGVKVTEPFNAFFDTEVNGCSKNDGAADYHNHFKYKSAFQSK